MMPAAALIPSDALHRKSPTPVIPRDEYPTFDGSVHLFDIDLGPEVSNAVKSLSHFRQLYYTLPHRTKGRGGNASGNRSSGSADTHKVGR